MTIEPVGVRKGVRRLTWPFSQAREREMFKTIHDIKAANRAAGGHWFDADTMAFFDSRVIPVIYQAPDGGAWFISSERRPEGFDGYRAARYYTIRHASAGGEITTVGGFQGYGTAHEARAAIAALQNSQ